MVGDWGDIDVAAGDLDAGQHGGLGADDLTLDENLVASLVDLIRMAEADRARVPARRRTLELATAPPAASTA